MAEKAGIDLNYALGLTPKKAVEYFGAKGMTVSWNWYDVWEEAHAQAFTVAKAMKMDILQDIRDSVTQAIQAGKSFQTFKDELTPTLQAKGWWGKGPVAYEVKPGVFKKAQLGSPWRLETIYRTNLQSAYMAGRQRQMWADRWVEPYWQYLAVLDSRTRPAHKAMDRKIFKANDAFWQTHYPPNGYNCRCRVRGLTTEDVKESGENVETGDSHMLGLMHKLPNGSTKPMTAYQDPVTGKLFAPDPGFGASPTKFWMPDLSKYDPDIAALYSQPGGAKLLEEAKAAKAKAKLAQEAQAGKDAKAAAELKAKQAAEEAAKLQAAKKVGQANILGILKQAAEKKTAAMIGKINTRLDVLVDTQGLLEQSQKTYLHAMKDLLKVEKANTGAAQAKVAMDLAAEELKHAEEAYDTAFAKYKQALSTYNAAMGEAYVGSDLAFLKMTDNLVEANNFFHAQKKIIQEDKAIWIAKKAAVKAEKAAKVAHAKSVADTVKLDTILQQNTQTAVTQIIKDLEGTPAAEWAKLTKTQKAAKLFNQQGIAQSHISEMETSIKAAETAGGYSAEAIKYAKDQLSKANKYLADTIESQKSLLKAAPKAAKAAPSKAKTVGNAQDELIALGHKVDQAVAPVPTDIWKGFPSPSSPHKAALLTEKATQAQAYIKQMEQIVEEVGKTGMSEAALKALSQHLDTAWEKFDKLNLSIEYLHGVPLPITPTHLAAKTAKMTAAQKAMQAEKAAEAAKKAAEAAQAAAQKAEIERQAAAARAPFNGDDLKAIPNTQKGSNPGGQYKDSHGRTYYVKFYADPDQARIEHAAARINLMMGVQAPETRLAQVVNAQGKKQFAFVSNWEPTVRSFKGDAKGLLAQEATEIARSYHAAVLTKNWDVIGAEFDNLVATPTGGMMIVDSGGAFTFRAQGMAKEYGKDIAELASLRDTSKPAGQIFDTLFKKYPTLERESAKAIKLIDNKANVQALFEQTGLTKAKAKELTDTLWARRQAMIDHYELEVTKERIGEVVQFHDPENQQLYNSLLRSYKKKTNLELASAIRKECPNIHASISSWQGATTGEMPMGMKYRSMELEAPYKVVRAQGSVRSTAQQAAAAQKIPVEEYIRARAIGQAYLYKQGHRSLKVYRGIGGEAGSTYGEMAKGYKKAYPHDWQTRVMRVKETSLCGVSFNLGTPKSFSSDFIWGKHIEADDIVIHRSVFGTTGYGYEQESIVKGGVLDFKLTHVLFENVKHGTLDFTEDTWRYWWWKVRTAS